jgi:hypothetical protein
MGLNWKKKNKKKQYKTNVTTKNSDNKNSVIANNDTELSVHQVGRRFREFVRFQVEIRHERFDVALLFQFRARVWSGVGEKRKNVFQIVRLVFAHRTLEQFLEFEAKVQISKISGKKKKNE